MTRNPASDFLLFIAGSCLFCAGGFLLASQVMAAGGFSARFYGGGTTVFPFGSPGMGLLMIPLGLGVCLLFADGDRRWANLLVWGSLAAISVGVLNSIRLTFLPTTLWQLGVCIVMLAAGGGLMFRSLGPYGGPPSRGPRWPD